MPVSKETIERIREKYNVKDDFKIGRRVGRLRETYKYNKEGNKITEEDKANIESIPGLLNKERPRIEIGLNLCEKLYKHGFDFQIKRTVGENGKRRDIKFGELLLPKEVLEQIQEEEQIPWNWDIGRFIRELREEYTKTNSKNTRFIISDKDRKRIDNMLRTYSTTKRKRIFEKLEINWNV